MVIAIAVAAWLTRQRQRSLPLLPEQRFGLGFAVFVGSMLGAKAPFLWELGWQGLLNGTIWFADGKTIIGGIVGGYIAVEIAKPWLGIKFSTGDSFALPVAVAIMMGRLACFTIGCCYGNPTTLPWGMSFPAAGDSLPRHPTQLYEVFFHALAAVMLLVLYRRAWFVGNQLKLYLIAYLVYRFLSEWLRPEPKLWLSLTGYQWASMLLLGILIVLWRRPQQLPNPDRSSNS